MIIPESFKVESKIKNWYGSGQNGLQKSENLAFYFLFYKLPMQSNLVKDNPEFRTTKPSGSILKRLVFIIFRIAVSFDNIPFVGLPTAVSLPGSAKFVASFI